MVKAVVKPLDQLTDVVKVNRAISPLQIRQAVGCAKSQRIEPTTWSKKLVQQDAGSVPMTQARRQEQGHQNVSGICNYSRLIRETTIPSTAASGLVTNWHSDCNDFEESSV